MVSIRDLLLPTDDPPIKTEERDERFAKPTNPVPETTHFEIEFILDTVCPHCYICFRNLDAAIVAHRDQHPEATFEITCSPFILDPAGYQSAYRRAGIALNWDDRTGSNSRDSHKLLRFALEGRPTTIRSTAFMSRSQSDNVAPSTHAATLPGVYPTASSNSVSPFPSPKAAYHGTSTSTSTPPSYAHGLNQGTGTPPPQPRGPALQMRLASAIFALSFPHPQVRSSEGPPSHDDLLATGISVTGLPAAEIRGVLESEEWGATVDILCAEVRGRTRQNIGAPDGIGAVPTVIFQGRYLTSGWQETSVFVRIFESLRMGRNPTAAGVGSPSGASGAGGGSGAEGYTGPTGTGAAGLMGSGGPKGRGAADGSASAPAQ